MFDDSMQMNKQISMTPVHQASKTFEQNAERKLIIKIEATEDKYQPKCTISHDSNSAANEEQPELNSVVSSQERASQIMQTPKMQNLIKQIVRLKANRNNNNSGLKRNQLFDQSASMKVESIEK